MVLYNESMLHGRNVALLLGMIFLRCRIIHMNTVLDHSTAMRIVFKSEANWTLWISEVGVVAGTASGNGPSSLEWSDRDKRSPGGSTLPADTSAGCRGSAGGPAGAWLTGRPAVAGSAQRPLPAFASVWFCSADSTFIPNEASFKTTFVFLKYHSCACNFDVKAMKITFFLIHRGVRGYTCTKKCLCKMHRGLKRQVWNSIRFVNFSS